MAAMVGWVLTGVVVLGLFGAILERKFVMAEYPSTVRMYAMFGLADRPNPGGGLIFEDVSSARVSPDGAPKLVVEGRIVNTAAEPRDIPTLMGTLRDSSNREVKTWTFDAETRRLNLGESVRFRTELPNPPPTGTELSISFAP